MKEKQINLEKKKRPIKRFPVMKWFIWLLAYGNLDYSSISYGLIKWAKPPKFMSSHVQT